MVKIVQVKLNKPSFVKTTKEDLFAHVTSSGLLKLTLLRNNKVVKVKFSKRYEDTSFGYLKNDVIKIENLDTIKSLSVYIQ